MSQGFFNKVQENYKDPARCSSQVLSAELGLSQRRSTTHFRVQGEPCILAAARSSDPPKLLVQLEATSYAADLCFGRTPMNADHRLRSAAGQRGTRVEPHWHGCGMGQQHRQWHPIQWRWLPRCRKRPRVRTHACTKPRLRVAAKMDTDKKASTEGLACGAAAQNGDPNTNTPSEVQAAHYSPLQSAPTTRAFETQNHRLSTDHCI